MERDTLGITTAQRGRGGSGRPGHAGSQRCTAAEHPHATGGSARRARAGGDDLLGLSGGERLVPRDAAARTGTTADLCGASSPEYAAVNRAWAAVNVE